MSRPTVRVQHAVLCHTTRQYGSAPTSDLLGVQYTFTYAPDQEFPRHLPQLDLFTRFFIDRPGTGELVVRVWSLGVEGQAPTFVRAFGPHRVVFPADRMFLDHRFRVKYLPAKRPGLYAFRLCCRRKKGWRGGRWAILATEHLVIERG